MIVSECKLSSCSRLALEVVLNSGKIHVLELAFSGLRMLVPDYNLNS